MKIVQTFSVHFLLNKYCNSIVLKTLLILLSTFFQNGSDKLFGEGICNQKTQRPSGFLELNTQASKQLNCEEFL